MLTKMLGTFSGIGTMRVVRRLPLAWCPMSALRLHFESSQLPDGWSDYRSSNLLSNTLNLSPTTFKLFSPSLDLNLKNGYELTVSLESHDLRSKYGILRINGKRITESGKFYSNGDVTTFSSSLKRSKSIVRRYKSVNRKALITYTHRRTEKTVVDANEKLWSVYRLITSNYVNFAICSSGICASRPIF
jgi:hypothetical protein